MRKLTPLLTFLLSLLLILTIAAPAMASGEAETQDAETAGIDEEAPAAAEPTTEEPIAEEPAGEETDNDARPAVDGDDYEVLDNGVCGSGLTWKVTYAGDLTIEGTGAMLDRDPWDDEPDDWWSSEYNVNEQGEIRYISLHSAYIKSGVTSIGAYAFSGCPSLKSVSIPSTVKTIGNGAFSDCFELKSVNITEGVRDIGSYVFDGPEAVSLPASLETVGDYAFGSSLTSATYAGTPEQLSAIRFGEGNEYLKYLLLGYDEGQCGDDLTWRFEDGVLTIAGSGDMWDFDCAAPWNDFFEHGLSSGERIVDRIVIEEGVTGIGAYAFCSVTAESMSLPVSLERIGEGNFYEIDNGTEIIYAGTEAQRNRLVAQADSLALKMVWYGYLFGSCNDNVTWTLTKDGALTISGTGDMYDYTELWKQDFVGPSTYVFLVPWNPEGSCPQFSTSVVIEDGITSIMHWAFSHSRMTEITIPASVERIGDSVFWDCQELKSITFEGHAPTFEVMRITISEDSGLVSAGDEAETFYGLSLTAYYPANDPTWTEAVRKNYGGNITWIPYDATSEPISPFTAATYLSDGNAYGAAQVLQKIVGLAS